MKRRNRADHSALGQRRKSGTGKYDLGILFGYPADPGVVVNDNCASGRIGWDAPIAQVFSRYKGLLILQP
jgi:hypothetical protein